MVFERRFIVPLVNSLRHKNGMSNNSDNDITIKPHTDKNIKLFVSNEASVDVEGDVNITGNVDVEGDVDITGKVDVEGDVNITGNVDVEGDVNITGKLMVDEIYQKHPENEFSLLVPTGTINAYAGVNAPGGWLLCNGTEVSRSIYNKLFDIIGTIYGNGDGSTTFNLPDLRGRVVVSVDTTQPEFNVLGETGGSKTHTLTIDEMPSHSHSINDPGHSHTFANGDSMETDVGVMDNFTIGTNLSTSVSTTGITINNTGGGQPHNNLQPYMVLHYIIKV
jgi:microcystin-dependent protein